MCEPNRNENLSIEKKKNKIVENNLAIQIDVRQLDGLARVVVLLYPHE